MVTVQTVFKLWTKATQRTTIVSRKTKGRFASSGRLIRRLTHFFENFGEIAMKAWKTLVTLTGALALSSLATACGSDDDSGDGDGDVGDGDTGDGDTGDGDTGDGDTGDGDTGDGDMGGEGGGATCSSILEIAAATEELSSLVAAVEAAGIGSALERSDLTVFAPTNDAFADLLDGLGLEFSDLTADNLIPILTYHVAGSEVPSSAAISVAGMEDNTFATLGGTITLDLDGDDLVIDADEASATVVMADIEACNGVVHVVDAVLLPSITDIVVSQENFSGLETLIGSSDTDPTNVAVALDGPSGEGAWTLFAPNNDGVQDLIDADLGLSAEQVTTALLYHAYASESAVAAASVSTGTLTMAGGEDLDVDVDGGVTLNDATDIDKSVTTTDIYASNGIIHVIDGVLVPPSLVE